MPIYEFECRTCGERFEEIMSVSADTMPACPTCKTERNVVKRMSASAHVGSADMGSPGGSSGCAPSGGFS